MMWFTALRLKENANIVCYSFLIILIQFSLIRCKTETSYIIRINSYRVIWSHVNLILSGKFRISGHFLSKRYIFIRNILFNGLLICSLFMSFHITVGTSVFLLCALLSYLGSIFITKIIWSIWVVVMFLIPSRKFVKYLLKFKNFQFILIGTEFKIKALNPLF